MTKRSEDLPPPVNKRSSKSSLWSELRVAREEIETQQFEIRELRKALEQKEAGASLVRAQLASAYWRLGVIQAALAHTEPPGQA